MREDIPGKSHEDISKMMGITGEILNIAVVLQKVSLHVPMDGPYANKALQNDEKDAFKIEMDNIHVNKYGPFPSTTQLTIGDLLVGYEGPSSESTKLEVKLRITQNLSSTRVVS